MAAQPDPLRWKALTIVCAAFFMTILDVSIVNVALPSIGKSLHFSRDDLQWVITAYAITFGGFLLLAGRCRPVRAPARLPHRRRHLHGRLALLRARLVRGRPHRRPRRARCRRGGHHPVRALDRDDDVRRRRRAEQGARHLGRARRRRRRGRRARWRDPHEVPRLEVDLLRQRPGRCGCLRAGAALRP